MKSSRRSFEIPPPASRARTDLFRSLGAPAGGIAVPFSRAQNAPPSIAATKPMLANSAASPIIKRSKANGLPCLVRRNYRGDTCLRDEPQPGFCKVL
jgi:hypothetical protein